MRYNNEDSRSKELMKYELIFNENATFYKQREGSRQARIANPSVSIVVDATVTAFNGRKNISERATRQATSTTTLNFGEKVRILADEEGAVEYLSLEIRK